MEALTYVTEASALIEGIHEIKQWVYDGSVRILIPLSTYEQVEKAYKAATAPKDVPKDSTTARTIGRAARKEHPLFDINPRAAWEFLSRAKSDKGEAGVRFQQQNEEFTQWKEEDEKAASKIESPQAAPTSFAEALLRKLNMKSESDSDEPKAPPKPRLIARSNEPKSPWKYHKIPTVSSKGLPPESKPLFSSILWSLYESEKNPLKPEKFVLLAGSSESLSLAEKLEIPVTMITSLRTYLLDIRLKLERRLQFGQLEATFPEALTKMGATNRACTLHNGMPTKNGDKSLNPIEQAIPAAEVQKDGTISKEEQSLLSSPPGPKAERKASEEDTAGGMPPVKESTLAMVTNPFEDEPKASISEVRNLLESGTVQLSQSSTSESSKATDPSPQLLAQPFRPSTAQKPNVDESDLDSDEEIIVFNPRARKTSGKKSREAPRSRPATANGPAPKILKSSPKEPSARSGTSAENKINGGLDTLGPSQSDGEISSVIEAEVQATIGKLKPKIESTLKAESPVFTPGKPFIQTLQQPVAELKPEASAESNRDSPPKSPSLLNNARNVPPRHPRAAMQQRHPSQERVRLQRESQQRESEKMIQRQRDAIQRRVKVVEKPSRKAAEKSAEAEPAAEKIAEKPPPRQIQLEPTNNPTVIDPDAFDRSYVVQPPASGSTTKSSVEKRRSRGHEHRRREAKRSQGSPKRNSKTPEPEVDYVLKSGAPRGSLRGKGKLWEP